MQPTGTGGSRAACVDIGTAPFAEGRDENME
jgi:hypothetical protein